MKRWIRNTLTGLGTLGLSLAIADYVKAQSSNSPASYYGHAFDRGVEVDDSTLVRVYDTNGTGDGATTTDDDQLIGEGMVLTYNGEKWFNVNALTDDPGTTADEGATEGGNTYFKLVRKSDGKEDLAYQDADMTTHIIKHESGVSKNVNAYTDFSTGIGMLEEYSNGVKIFPNPADDFINGEYRLSRPGNVGFRIFDITGREIERHRIEGNAGENRFRIDTDLVPGTYILQMDVNGKPVSSTKFIEK